MKLHQIRDVLTVAEKGSLRAAARHLGLAQPAVTRSIRELERELGVPLFERQARGTVLTPMGRLFVRRAGAAASELRRAREEIEQHQGAVEGSLLVCLSSVPVLALLPPALPAFRQRYPRVRLRIVEGVYPILEPRLKDGSADFYVGVAPDVAPAPELAVEKLFENTRVVLARPGHPLSRAKSLVDLAEAEWISTSITDKAEAEYAALFARHGLPPPRLAAQAESFLGLIVLLTYSDMLAIVPRQWTEFAPLVGALQKIGVKEELPAPAIVIVRRAALPLTPAGEYFCDLLRRASTPYVKPTRGRGRS